MYDSPNNNNNNNNNNTLICKKLGNETVENLYSHVPKAMYEHKNITVLWNQGVQADKGGSDQ